MSIDSAWEGVPEFTIADYLRKARIHAGLDQGQLADEIGVSRSTIKNYELGHVKPRKIVLNAWAMRTGVPLEWITSLGTANPRPGVRLVRHQGLEPRTR